jgi:hypothetical protein
MISCGTWYTNGPYGALGLQETTKLVSDPSKAPQAVVDTLKFVKRQVSAVPFSDALFTALEYAPEMYANHKKLQAVRNVTALLPASSDMEGVAEGLARFCALAKASEICEVADKQPGYMHRLRNPSIWLQSDEGVQRDAIKSLAAGDATRAVFALMYRLPEYSLFKHKAGSPEQQRVERCFKQLNSFAEKTAEKVDADEAARLLAGIVLGDDGFDPRAIPLTPFNAAPPAAAVAAASAQTSSTPAPAPVASAPIASAQVATPAIRAGAQAETKVVLVDGLFSAPAVVVAAGAGGDAVVVSPGPSNDEAIAHMMAEMAAMKEREKAMEEREKQREIQIRRLERQVASKADKDGAGAGGQSQVLANHIDDQSAIDRLKHVEQRQDFSDKQLHDLLFDKALRDEECAADDTADRGWRERSVKGNPGGTAAVDDHFGDHAASQYSIIDYICVL